MWCFPCWSKRWCRAGGIDLQQFLAVPGPMFSFSAFLGFDLQDGLQGIAGSVESVGVRRADVGTGVGVAAGLNAGINADGFEVLAIDHDRS